MRVIIGIASGATQRALVRNLNGKRGPLSLKNLAPCANNCRSFHDSALSCLWKIRAPCVAKYLQEVGTLPVRIGFRESMSSLGLCFQRESIAIMPLRVEIEVASSF